MHGNTTDPLLLTMVLGFKNVHDKGMVENLSDLINRKEKSQRSTWISDNKRNVINLLF